MLEVLNGGKARCGIVFFTGGICLIFSILFLGCSKSNPLVGKWKLASNSDPACMGLEGVEFSNTTMTLNVLTKQTFNVTYSRDGDRYLVNGTPTGTLAFKSESGGIDLVTPECHFVPES
jgi:hypothetical protein